VGVRGNSSGIGHFICNTVSPEFKGESGQDGGGAPCYSPPVAVFFFFSLKQTVL
jgi:hypothetical protein